MLVWGKQGGAEEMDMGGDPIPTCEAQAVEEDVWIWSQTYPGLNVDLSV